MQCGRSAAFPVCVALWSGLSLSAQPALELQVPADSPDGETPIGVVTLAADRFRLARPGVRSLPFEDSSLAVLPVELVQAGQMPEGDTPSAVAFTPDGTRIVVSHRDSGNLVVFDAATRGVLASIALSGSPNDVAISSDGVHAVTANVFEDTASIVDLDAVAEIAVVPIGAQPGVVRVTPDGTTAVVGNTVDGSLSVIAIASATELRRIPGAGFAGTVSVNFESAAVTATFSAFELADDVKLIHPDFFAHQIKIFDITDGSVTVLASENNPRGIAVTPDGTKAVVAHSSGVQRVSVVDLAGESISKVIDVGSDLFGAIAVDPTGTKAVVAVQNACRVVNLVTDAVSPALDTASVNQLLTTGDGAYALGVGFRGSLIDYSHETIVNELNNTVSTAVGAVSAVDPRGALVANTFGEDMLVVNADGAGGFIEGVVPSGPPPEGDKARSVAVTPGGSKAVVLNILSDNASIIDLTSRTVEAIVAVGDRPSEVEITGDGALAVVANLDSPFVSVIDLASHDVTSIPISTRGSQVEISPDGQYAYVAVVTADGVWRINLDTLAVEGPKLTTGNMGGVLYQFNQTSGMTLSHDGGTLVTCNSFGDSISIIDTASWSVVATVGVGDFPVRAVFAPNDARLFVSNRDDDTISRVTNAGALSSLTGSVNVGQWPFEMAVSSDGHTIYVANFQDDTIGVVDVASSTMTTTFDLPDNPVDVELDSPEDHLRVPTRSWSVTVGPGPAFSTELTGQFSVIEIASGSIVDQVVTDLPPAMGRVEETASLAVVPSPFGDGVMLIGLEAAVTPAGDIADELLVLDRLPGGDVELTWGASCLATDDDYEVYEGLFGDFTSHTPKLCTTAGASSATFTPAGGDRYYLVVPRNSQREGSYGRDGEGTERPPGLSTCAEQAIETCP